MARYPDIRIQFLMNTKVVDLIDSGIDIAIRKGKQNNSSLHARKIGVSNSVVCASPSYLQQHGVPTQPDDLTQHNCLSFPVQSKKQWKFNVNGQVQEVSINGRINANNLILLRNSAVAGLGIINILTWMVKHEIQQERLVPLL